MSRSGLDSDRRRVGGRSSRELDERWLDHGRVDGPDRVCPESGEAVEEREGCVYVGGG